MTTRSPRPASGATSTESTTRVSSAASTRWTSSSRRASVTVTTRPAARPANRAAESRPDSQTASRGTRPAARIRSASTSADRKFSCTNWPRVAANWSLRSTISAVCGMGRPSGRRNRAVTANQSATPPTIDASAPACTKPRKAPWWPSAVTTTNSTVTAPSRAVARRRATARACTRSAVDSCARARIGAGSVAVAGSMAPTILMSPLTSRAAPGCHEMTVVAAIVGGMGHGTTLDFDLATLRRAIGGGSFVRGTEYARQQAVLHVDWDPDGAALRGMVQGQGGHVYRTAAFLTLAPGQPAKFDMGECSCPVSVNCKHVVALVMTAVGSGTIEPPAPSRAAAWDQSLDSLLGPAAAPGAVPGTLWVELALTGGTGQATWGGPVPLGLTARLVRPGRGGWVAGDLSWARLDSLRLGSAHNDQQGRLVRELYALYQASSAQRGLHGYVWGQDRTIEFSAIGSRQLWPLLDEARAAGVALVQPGPAGELPGYDEADFCLDVTREADGGLSIVPVVSVAGRDPAVPVVFIGADGHGAVCLDRDQPRDGDPGQWPFRLARLARAVPAALQRMALQGTPLRGPAADETRFQRQYYPRLRQAATLTSSDGSVSLPEIGGPDLVLSARYGDGHDLDLSWAWAHRIRGQSRPPPGPPTPPRGRRIPRPARRADPARRRGHRGPAAA